MHSPEDDDHFAIPEDNDFCVALVEEVPALASLMRKHLEDEFGKIESYVFMSDVARWAEANAAANPAIVTGLVDALNNGIDKGDGDVPNLVVVGFVESLPQPTPIYPLINGSLKGWVDFIFGISKVQPLLRGQ
ncbi:hypothetical protein G7068_04560 [Leucobacter viscericola]|uniref:DUF7674 domain-containing protein n=1 Tax=Leucobacter viscericola TaxID=2714935 RepID=A0A6G7XDW8_9MICO|nr:hypothetical protein [Leucobacter viscericola]QIK62561.1 hypothetical protein G7068_04560 [Leucobacter viscericola]